MKTYWTYKIVLLLLLLIALGVFYLKCFTKTGFIFLVAEVALLVLLNLWNDRRFKKDRKDKGGVGFGE